MRHELREHVSGEVRALLARRQLHQADLVPVLGVNQGQVSKRLRGVIPWDIDEIEQLADFFDVEPSDLIRSNAWMNGSDDLDLADDSANVVGADFPDREAVDAARSRHPAALAPDVTSVPHGWPFRADERRKAS